MKMNVKLSSVILVFLLFGKSIFAIEAVNEYSFVEHSKMLLKKQETAISVWQDILKNLEKNFRSKMSLYESYLKDPSSQLIFEFEEDMRLSEAEYEERSCLEKQYHEKKVACFSELLQIEFFYASLFQIQDSNERQQLLDEKYAAFENKELKEFSDVLQSINEYNTKFRCSKAEATIDS